MELTRGKGEESSTKFRIRHIFKFFKQVFFNINKFFSNQASEGNKFLKSC